MLPASAPALPIARFAGLFPPCGGPRWDRFGQQALLVLLGACAVTLAPRSSVGDAPQTGRSFRLWTKLDRGPPNPSHWLASPGTVASVFALPGSRELRARPPRQSPR
jgi:hypothetical protein